MTRSFSLLRGILVAAAVPFAIFHAPLAAAASITISNEACESFTLDGTPGNQSLVCVTGTSPTPVCQVTGASNAVVGSTITLTASCSGSPTSYAWSGGNCQGTSGATCGASSDVIGSVAYSVTATNANGPGNPSPAKNVNWTALPSAVPSCTLSASPPTVAATGGAVTLTAACNNNPTSFVWSEEFVSGETTTQVNTRVVTNALPGSTFNVIGHNAVGPGPQAKVTIGTSTGGTTGTTSILSCPGYTSAQTKVMDVAIPASGFTKYVVTTSGIFRDGKVVGFYENDVMVVVFKAPPADQAWDLTFVQTGDGIKGPAATRTVVLSKKPCDFQYPKGPDAIWADQAPNMALTLASGAPSPYSRYTLVPGQEYYVNIRNKLAGGGGCTPPAGGRCDISFATANPKP